MSEDLLTKIYEKVDKIAEDVGDIKLIQAVMKEDVRHHVKRSETMEHLWNHLKEKEIDPIKTEMNQIRGAYKLLAGIGIVASIVMAILKVFGK